MNVVLRVCAALLVLVLGGVALTACGDDDKGSDRPGVALPSDFPSDDVPLVDGALLSASGRDGVWRLTVQGSAADGNALVNATKKLTDEGFTESDRTGDASNQTVTLSKSVDGGTLWVSVGVSADASAGPSTLFYQVTKTK
ncbi:hypothetical protein nbrc107696_18070 [Gordonia spumicola]|uniref:Lipoprotein n=1 Tax=Gordonia spumicola TaxID=589161 RepID=A0A7I9V8C6_9ACTN|nr:hypothetical protein [Gordonia spumicola]GEE01361.1 hypothetical protein nbrc107696_18070 [Gordonia spumicola]